MIRINLLPVRQTRKLESVRRELFVAMVVGVIVIGGCLVVWAGLQARLLSVESDNKALQAEIDRLDIDVKKVDEMELAKKELQTKLEVIAKLRTQKVGPVHMLDEIAIATPEKLTITSVDESRGAIKITGFSVSNEVISQFLRALESSDYFKSVYLENIEVKDNKSNKNKALQGVSLKEFKLTAVLITPKTAAEKAADAAKTAAPAEAAPAVPAPGASAAPGGSTPSAPAAAGAPAGSPTPAAAPAPVDAPKEAGK